MSILSSSESVRCYGNDNDHNDSGRGGYNKRPVLTTATHLS